MRVESYGCHLLKTSLSFRNKTMKLQKKVIAYRSPEEAIGHSSARCNCNRATYLVLDLCMFKFRWLLHVG